MARRRGKAGETRIAFNDTTRRLHNRGASCRRRKFPLLLHRGRVSVGRDGRRIFLCPAHRRCRFCRVHRRESRVGFASKRAGARFARHDRCRQGRRCFWTHGGTAYSAHCRTVGVALARSRVWRRFQERSGPVSRHGFPLDRRAEGGGDTCGICRCEI